MKRRAILGAVALLVVYLIGVAFGFLVILVYPVTFREKPSLLSRAGSVAAEYSSGGDVALEQVISNIRSPILHILVYHADGRCFRHEAPYYYNAETDMDAYLANDLPKVLSGETCFTVKLTYESRTSWNRFCEIVGVPIPSGGAVFLIRNMENLQEAFTMYLLCFTLLYWMGMGLLLLYLQNRQKLERTRQHYVDNVTHALKTPVASVKALAETLCDGVERDPDQQRVLYGMILREANLQGHMIRDILELSKLQSHGKDFSRKNHSAQEIFEPVLQKYSGICDCTEVTLTAAGLDRLPMLYTNKDCAREILEMLLDNALKFVDEPGEVRIEFHVAPARVTVCVRDNGTGIAKEDLPHVFERFFKSGGARNESGNGLGLAIAKELASGMREKIWVESKAGVGAAFFFTLRRARC